MQSLLPWLELTGLAGEVKGRSKSSLDHGFSLLRGKERFSVAGLRLASRLVSDRRGEGRISLRQKAELVSEMKTDITFPIPISLQMFKVCRKVLRVNCYTSYSKIMQRTEIFCLCSELSCPEKSEKPVWRTVSNIKSVQGAKHLSFKYVISFCRSGRVGGRLISWP